MNLLKLLTAAGVPAHLQPEAIAGYDLRRL